MSTDLPDIASFDVEESARRLLHALLCADRVAALQEAAGAVEHGLAVTDVHQRVIQVTMDRIGSLWATGQISIAAEHTATAIVQFVVTSLYPRIERSENVHGRAVVAGAAGELHQLGAHMVSDALEGDGWQVRFLGVNCPHR